MLRVIFSTNEFRLVEILKMDMKYFQSYQWTQIYCPYKHDTLFKLLRLWLLSQRRENKSTIS